MMPTERDDREVITQLIELADDFARAASEDAIWSAVTRHGRRLLGAEHALVLRRGNGIHPDYSAFAPVYWSPGLGEVKPFEAVASLVGKGLVNAPPAAPAGGAFRPLFDALAAAAPAGLVYAPLDLRDVLVLVFGEDQPLVDRFGWVLLETLAAQAGAALVRGAAIARVAELSLRDPLTGLGNRHLVEVILERSFPQALRGDPLAVVAIRCPIPPGAEPENHDGAVADRLRPHVREADVVARLHAGVFVVVLHSCGPSGAELFVNRVQADLPAAALRWVVAEPDSRYETEQELLETVLGQGAHSPA